MFYTLSTSNKLPQDSWGDILRSTIPQEAWQPR